MKKPHDVNHPSFHATASSHVNAAQAQGRANADAQNRAYADAQANAQESSFSDINPVEEGKRTVAEAWNEVLAVIYRGEKTPQATPWSTGLDVA